ncbi:hypothetical protein JB92DRAFT_3143717 [Gautieria morchelliformis]|nr:hypothetical protein JB92DRAFT_3143717 [Gautieria morchelliformis]
MLLQLSPQVQSGSSAALTIRSASESFFRKLPPPTNSPHASLFLSAHPHPPKHYRTGYPIPHQSSHLLTQPEPAVGPEADAAPAVASHAVRQRTPCTSSPTQRSPRTSLSYPMPSTSGQLSRGHRIPLRHPTAHSAAVDAAYPSAIPDAYDAHTQHAPPSRATHNVAFSSRDLRTVHGTIARRDSMMVAPNVNSHLRTRPPPHPPYASILAVLLYTHPPSASRECTAQLWPTAPSSPARFPGRRPQVSVALRIHRAGTGNSNTDIPTLATSHHDVRVHTFTPTHAGAQDGQTLPDACAQAQRQHSISCRRSPRAMTRFRA